MKAILANKKIRIILIAVGAVLIVAAAAVVFLLRDRLFPQKEEVDLGPVAIEAPLQYALGEEKFLALPAGNAALVYEMEAVSLAAQAEAIEEAGKEQIAVKEEPADGEEEPAPEEEVSPLVAYRYEGMADTASQVRAYIELLTTEDMGFLHANEELKELEEEPKLYAKDTAYLIYRIPEPEEEEAAETEDEGEPQAIALCIDWERGKCDVTAELIPEAMTHYPPEPVRPLGGAGTGLTFSGAVDTIKAMHPSVLELDGESMEAYRVYSRDGLALIDGQSCMRIDIYKEDEKTGTNTVAGNYFISADGLHLYQFNQRAQSVRELPMTTVN